MNSLPRLDVSAWSLALPRAAEATGFAEWYPFRVRYMLAAIRRSGMPYRMRLAASVEADCRAGQMHRQLVTVTSNKGDI